MAINRVDSHNPAIQHGQAQQAKNAKKIKAQKAYENEGAKPTAENSAAKVSVSQRAKDLSVAHKAIRDTPDVREDKVAHFKALLEKGEYKPDAGKIVDGMLKEAIKDEVAKDPSFIMEPK